MKKNPISLQFHLKLSSLLHPFLYPWQVIISPINPGSFIPGLWSSLLREKLIVISSQYLPESFLPERVVEKWKVKIVALYVTMASGSPGASTSWANRAALITAHLKCGWERETGEARLTVAFHHNKIEPMLLYSTMEDKSESTFGSLLWDWKFL